MSVMSWLDILFVQPVLLIYGAVFSWLLAVGLSEGSAIIAFSLLIGLATTPLYRQMEGAKAGLAASRAAMGSELRRMERHYSGRELYYYRRAVYRQFKYHPIQAVTRSTDLYLQVAVFATVFRFLGDPNLLGGVRFGPISDLGTPDGLLAGANLLPFLMTFANVFSVLSYTRQPRERWTALALALSFLVVLYGSAAGMVLYWTCNNLFSLVRNIIARHRIARGAPSWASSES